MLMLSKHCVTVNGIAETIDLLCNISLSLIERLECLCCRVASFICILDWSWVAIVIDLSPLSFVGLENLVWQIGESDFLGTNNELISSVACFWLRTQKSQYWNSSYSPSAWVTCEIFDTHSLASETWLKDWGCSKSKSGSKTAIKESWMGSSSLVTKEVSNWSELALVLISCCSLFKLLWNEMSNELFSLNHGKIDFTGKFLLIDHLLLHELGKSCVEGETPWWELALNDRHILELFNQILFVFRVLAVFEEVIELNNEMLVSWNVTEKTFWNENSSEIFAIFGSFNNDIANSIDNVIESFSSVGALLWNDGHVWMGSEGTFKSKMRWVLAHQPDEVPIFDGRGWISEHVSNQLRVDLWSSVKTEWHLQELMSDVSVKSGWNTGNVGFYVVFQEVLCKSSSISQSVGSTDQDETSNLMLLHWLS